MTLVFKHKDSSGQPYSTHFFTFFSTIFILFKIKQILFISEYLCRFSRNSLHCPLTQTDIFARIRRGHLTEGTGQFLFNY